MLPGQPAQHLGFYAVAAQENYSARTAFDAVLRVTQTDRSAAARYHHVLQRGRVEWSRGHGIEMLAQSPDEALWRRRAVNGVDTQSHDSGVAEQRLDDNGRGLLVDLAGGQVETSECLVDEFEADAAVHRGQRRLCRPGIRITGQDPFPAGGQQPHGSASWAGDRVVVR